jgi:hypothetical protein
MTTIMTTIILTAVVIHRARCAAASRRIRQYRLAQLNLSRRLRHAPYILKLPL